MFFPQKHALFYDIMVSVVLKTVLYATTLCQNTFSMYLYADTR